MSKVINKLKNNLKDIRNNKLNIIEEILSLIIFWMPIVISVFSIVIFYIENKNSTNFTGKAMEIYLNIPFWIMYVCLIILTIIIMFIKYFRNKENLRKNKIKVAAILILAIIIFMVMIALLISKEKIIIINQNLIKILTFNKGMTDDVCGMYILLFLVMTIIPIVKIFKKEYKEEFNLIITSLCINLLFLPLIVWFASNIAFLIFLIMIVILMHIC